MECGSLRYTVLELINETWYFVALLTKCTVHCLFMPAATKGKAGAGVRGLGRYRRNILPVTSEFRHVTVWHLIEDVDLCFGGENAILCYCNILKDALRLFGCPSTSAGKVALKRHLKINWTAKWKCYYFSYFSARKLNAFLSHNKKTDRNNFLANLMFAFLATKRTTVIICVDFPSQHCISVRLLWNYTQHALFPFNKVPWKLRQYAFFLSCLRYLCIKLGQCFQWQTNNL